MAQILVFPAENILYGILQILIYSFVLEKILILGNTRTQMLVISPEHEKITSYILHEVDRGVTLLDGCGGYTKKSAELVLSIVSNRQVPRIEKEIRQIDPNAMIIKSSIMEVSGRGFTLAKQYIS